MEFNVNKLRQNVHYLVSLIQGPKVVLQFLNTFAEKTKLNAKDVESLIKFLSANLLVDSLTVPIAVSFEDCLLLLITNAVGSPSDEVKSEHLEQYQWSCVAFSKLVQLSSDAKRYALSYFANKPAPFSSQYEQQVIGKKPKSNVTSPDSLTIVKCCYNLLKIECDYFKELWDWSEFVEKYVKQVDGSPTKENLYINHILSMITNMPTLKLNKLNANIPVKVLMEFDEEQSFIFPYNVALRSKNILPDQLVTIDLNSHFVTNVEGVLLPIFNWESYDFYSKSDGHYDKIVRVDSTVVNLRSIALGVKAAKPICLSGPVGCGKTTLVEYLARKTGRIAPKQTEIENSEIIQEMSKENQNGIENKQIRQLGSKRKTETVNKKLIDIFSQKPQNGFLRIQLGDQTDSKMLLGQYHCTDVPGEFIWLPGVLTQAVMNGYWLLLEDLDSATQDTYTVLSGLFENNYLSVPGFRDCVKVAPGFQLFVTVRTNRTSTTNSSQKALFSLLEKYLYTINVLPLSRNELCKVVSANYPRLATVANRIVDVFLTFSSGDHSAVADSLRQQELCAKSETTEEYVQLPSAEVSWESMKNAGRLVSTRDLVKLCQRSNPSFSVTSTECAYFVFQNAVDVFCSYLPYSKDKTKLITCIGAKLGIIQSRCEHFAEEYKPEVCLDIDRIKVGRAELSSTKSSEDSCTTIGERLEQQAFKRQKLANNEEVISKTSTLAKKSATFSFTRLASCLLERIAVCVAHAEPILLVGETGVGKTSSVQYLAEKTKHNLVVVNMNNQSDVSDLVGGFKPVDLTYVIAPLRSEFEILFRQTFNQSKNESFITKFSICYNQGNFSVIVKLMLKITCSVFEKSERNELKDKHISLIPRWTALRVKLQKLNNQLAKSINISFAFIPGSLVNCIKNGDWVLLDEINLASAETLECLSTILEPDGSVVLLEKGDFTPVKRHPDFRIFACMNPSTDIGKKDLSVGIRNRFTEFFVDEINTDADLSLLISDYLNSTGIQRKSVMNIVQLYKRLKHLARLELNDGLGNRPVYSLRTLCRSLRICAKNLCGSIERNLYESFSMSFLTQLDPQSHKLVQTLIKDAMLSNANAILKQQIPKPAGDYLNFEGYWIQQGPNELQECANYIMTDSVRKNLKDLARIISIGKLPILLQGPTSAGKTSLIDYVGRKSGNQCLRINNHEHTDLQEYIGTYTAEVTGKLTFKEGVLVQAMRNGYWIILDELNLASTEILEALNRVLDDNRELFIPETQTVIKAHPNFMLFATQNPPGLYGGRKTLSRAFKNRFIELHFSDIPRNELEIILEKRCLIPASYARKMVSCMSDLQKNRKTTSKNVFTLRDLFRWGNRYTLADKKLLEDTKYDWNQHLIEEGYLVLSAKVRTDIEIEIIEDALYKNFKKRIDLNRLFDASSSAPEEKSPVTKDIIKAIQSLKLRSDIVWTRNMSRTAILTGKALQFNEPVLLVGPTGCGKTTVCQLLSLIQGVQLRILNCHMHTEGADFLGGLRPCRGQSDNEPSKSKILFEWADGPLIHSMQEGSYFMADEISLAEDSVLERLNCILEPERTVLLAEKGGVTSSAGTGVEITKEFVIQAKEGFQFLATMNPGGDFGKKELSPALRNRFTEIWCLASDARDDLIQIASNCMKEQLNITLMSAEEINQVATFIVDIVLYMQGIIDKFKFSVRDILAMANYIVTNDKLTFHEKAIYGLETIFLDALEMLPFETVESVEILKTNIKTYALNQLEVMLKEKFTLDSSLQQRNAAVVEFTAEQEFGIKPFYIQANIKQIENVPKDSNNAFMFDAPTTKQNLFRLLSALSLKKPILLEGPPGVGKTSIVESIAKTIGFNIVRINLCEHTDLADLFGTDLPAEDNILNEDSVRCGAADKKTQIGSFIWRDGPLLAALKSDNTWILLDELNLAPQSVLEGLNAILDHRGEVYIPELNKTFSLNKQTRIFACQNPLKQGGGRKGLPQSFLNRFTKVYLRKLTTEDLLHVVNGKYREFFHVLETKFIELLKDTDHGNIQGGNLFDIYKSMKINAMSQTAEMGFTFDLTSRLVRFSEHLDQGAAKMEFGYKGGPFEINLRDILRWCDLLHNAETGFIFKKNNFLENFNNFLLTLYERMKLVYYQRMRCDHDKLYIRNAFAQIFQCDAEYFNSISEDVSLYWTSEKVYLNDIVLNRDQTQYQTLRSQASLEYSPILLSSQREILKNIVECVHMEKPVLLSGSTDTGKTKIINTLCTLSQQMCNTDTIDDSVTGSFQQIDLNRHLEDISQQLKCVYLEYIQELIMQPSLKQNVIMALLNCWSQYAALSNSKCEFQNSSAMSEELINFRQRIEKLNNLINKLLNEIPNKVDTVQTLNWLQKRLKILKSHVENADSLNTGGFFEWVDSKIVQSLKCGQYISLDHVNLCSSAVLDRLNPVFEPNGSLMISEKGVSVNDEAEIVEKSKNFRAFLTIDPKNGELSRAMRNRCVELSMQKDVINVDDKRLLVYHEGIHDIDAINCLIQIHESICNLTEINSFTISHLTKMAFLTCSYKKIGYDMETSIHISAMEVYVYCATIDLMGYGLHYYQNKLREIVINESKRYGELKTEPADDDYLKEIMQTCGDLSEMGIAKLQIQPLKILLKTSEKNFQQTLQKYFSAFQHIKLDDINANDLTRYLIYILYNASSVNDLELRYLYLDKILQGNNSWKKLSEILYQSVNGFATTFKVHNLLPWNSKLYPRIRDYCSTSLESKSFCLSSILFINTILSDVPQGELKKLSDIDALTYSQAICSNRLTDKLNNAFLKYLAVFLTSLNGMLKNNLKEANMNLSQHASLVTSVHWFNRLLAMAQTSIFVNKEINSDLMDKLLLHFKWLEKNLLRLLHTIMPNYQNASANFEESLQKMTHYALSVKHPLNLMRKLFTKEIIHFQPFYQEDQVKLHSMIRDMDQLLQVVPQYGCYTATDVVIKFIAQKSSFPRKLHNIAANIYSANNLIKLKEIQFDQSGGTKLPNEFKVQLQEFLNAFSTNNDRRNDDDASAESLELYKSELENLAKFVSQQKTFLEEDSNNFVQLANKPKEIELYLLSLREYFLLRYVIAQHANGTKELSAINREYYEEVTTLSNTSLKLLDAVGSLSHQNFHSLWSKINAFVEDPDHMQAIVKYLNGGYKHISAHHKLILNSLLKLQLEAVSNNSKCLETLRSGDEISSTYEYTGPALINTITNMLFNADGSFKCIPLCDLELWKQHLDDVNQIVWHNSLVMTPHFNATTNNFSNACQNAKRLLTEVEYVKDLCENVENENFTNFNEGFQKLVAILKQQIITIPKDNISCHLDSLANQKLLYNSAMLSATMGCIELCVITFMPLIDPVEKNRLKNAYIAEDIQNINLLKTAYDFMRVTMKYKNLGGEIYSSLNEQLSGVIKRQNKLKQKVALRPEKSLYGNLAKDITHFLCTNCDPHSLCNLLLGTQTQWEELSQWSKTSSHKSLEKCNELVNKLDLWMANSKRFVSHILKPYQGYYQDFLDPIQCAIDQVRFGMEGLKKVLTQLSNCMLTNDSQSYSNINEHGKLHRVLENIVCFPSNKMLNIFNVSSTKDVLQNKSPIFSVMNNVAGSEYYYFRLLKAKLIELQNRADISSCIDENLFNDFYFAFNSINEIWQQEEQRRRDKKQEEESLYLTKTKCEDEDEEMVELEEIEEVFPTSVQEDFGDFIEDNTLEKVMKLDKKKNLKARESAVVVRDEDYAFIAKTFVQILVRYTQTYYHHHFESNGGNAAAAAKGFQQEEYLNFVDYFKERLKVYVKLYQSYKSALNETADEHTFNAFCLSIWLQRDSLTENSRIASKADTSYNFYKDSNIMELDCCTDVLQTIMQKVEEQLSLYSEHATLMDIKRVIERIRVLPATAPISRFNAGFQILRQKVAQWNEVAHKNNNLKTEEQQIAEYVQKWTRLELQFWRNCLSQTYDKVESSAYKYWFFIYNLFQEYVQDNEIDSSLTDIKYTEKRFEEQQILDDQDIGKKSKITSNQIIQILRQFVESSSYGDFQIRLHLLHSFELYLHNVINSTADDSLRLDTISEMISALHNLQLYFAQFGPEIEEHKKSIKLPIEKKLKELVKIESYNKDLSYFSMRNNVARVHRNLNKFLKEYEQQLRQKITSVFQPKDATARDYNLANEKGKDLRYESKIKYYMIDIKHFIAPAQKLQNTSSVDLALEDENQTLLCKVSRLFSTSRNVVKEIISNAQYANLIVSLDTLLTEQLERCDHLRNLTVDRSKERAHQKIEAKQILQQKRKGLSDLFKQLTRLGVSYKTGLMELSIRTEFEDFKLSPFCIRTMLAQIKDKHIQPNMLQLNENLNNYFSKCVFKLKLLQNLMLAPLSELGPPNIERIKGFAVDLFLLVQNQRQLLSTTTKNIYDLRSILLQFKELLNISAAAKEMTKTTTATATLDESCMEFLKLKENYNALKMSFCEIRYVFEQFKLLLNSIPSQRKPENCLFANMHENVLVRDSIQYAKLDKLCHEILKVSKASLKELNKNNQEFINKQNVDKHKENYNHLITSVQESIKCLEATPQEYLPLAKPLIDLLASVTNIMKNAEIYSPKDLSSDSAFENIDTELENIIHSILLSLQKLYKKCPTKPSQNNDDKSSTNAAANENNEEFNADTLDDIQEQHLKRKLYDELKDDWTVMNMEGVNKKLCNILLEIKLQKANPAKLTYIQKILTLEPLLEQYHLMADYYLFQQLGAHKVSVKMLSVLLTVFVEIASKGFCVPQDLMQDEEGEAKKDQKEGEGFGLEDGTGEKDASDKIESEDQLDDAKRPEDRKEENKDEQSDCKEEKGIDMSDDFDGKLQDKEKPEDDDSAESEEEEEDMSKEMGETEEGADKLDDQIWGDDEEPEEEEEPKDMEEEDGKGNKDENDSHNDLDANNEASKEDGKEEQESDALDATNQKDDKRKQQEKDIDDMKDQEQDEEQTNSYHNELEEPPEPEEMDLGDMNVDEDNEDREENPNDDNPFDIDSMKENMENVEDNNNQDEENNEAEEENKENHDSGGDDSADSEDENETSEKDDKITADDGEQKPEEKDNKEDTEEPEKQTRGEAEPEEENPEESDNKREEKPEDYEQSKDKSSKEENIQTQPDTETKGSHDEAQTEETEKDVEQQDKMDEQETGEDKDGVGQAENEETEGHQGIAETKEAVAQEERKNDKQTREKRKQGQTNEERSLGEAEKNKIKQLKTIDKLKEDSETKEEEENESAEQEDKEAEEYQHVKEPKNSDKTTLDNATEEQSKQIKHQEDETKDITAEEENQDANMELDEDNAEEEITEDSKELQQLEAEKLENKKDAPSKTEKANERTDAQEEMEIEGEIVQTMNVPRSEDTIAYCNKDILLDNSSQAQELTTAETLELRKMYQSQVTTQKAVVPQTEDFEIWQTISNRMTQNARDLCEQLRLILEPTKCTRLKGDYRTGRRINMKKIIPYIASQFRKDKIWLRRTKPAQRDYKIIIAIDDSKSMHHNNSKTLTLEAISLVSQALTLLESGRLSVLSFGEQPQIILNHTEQFNGPKLVNCLEFSQDKTKIAEMLDFVRTLQTEEGSLGSDNGIFENLVLVLSDGRNIYSEGKARVKNAIKLARLQRIFLVYIIIDNPENKNSILDIQTMEMLPDKRINIKSYLDDFPFPYYVIVRDLNQLPLVLSEAMRQWFELVNSEQ